MRVLVVEDERRIAGSIKKGLEQETYAVDLAYDGETGLDLGVSEEYDLIILDRMLPKIDGLEVCRKLRQAGIQVPVLILTAKGEIADKVEGLDIGADDYMTKPFAFDELVARIRALIRRPREKRGEILQSGDLVLNPATFEVKRKGKTVDLSNKEFAILEFLLRNTGAIVPKEKIINNVWDYDADVLPNTVEVNIRNLRNKIEKAFDRKEIIKTVRGFGYRIDK